MTLDEDAAKVWNDTVREEVNTFLAELMCYLDTHYHKHLQANSGSMRKSMNGYIRNNLPRLLNEAADTFGRRCAEAMQEECAKVAETFPVQTIETVNYRKKIAQAIRRVEIT